AAVPATARRWHTRWWHGGNTLVGRHAAVGPRARDGRGTGEPESLPAPGHPGREEAVPAPGGPPRGLPGVHGTTREAHPAPRRPAPAVAATHTFAAWPRAQSPRRHTDATAPLPAARGGTSGGAGAATAAWRMPPPLACPGCRRLAWDHWPAPKMAAFACMLLCG